MRYGFLLLLALVAGLDARADGGSDGARDFEQVSDGPSPRVRELIEQLKGEDCCKAMGELARLGPEAIPAVPSLARILKHERWTRQLFAATTLSSIGPGAKAATAELIEALGNENGHVRDAAGRALRTIGAPAMPEVTRALHHPNKFVRENAAQALGEMGAVAQPALPDLKRALADEDKRVRAYAQEAIEAIQKKSRARSPAKQ